jgi:hypothetical protein
MVPTGSAEAQAAVGASINLGTFYDRLAPYGDWVSRDGLYVFVPVVDANWRPYTLGHWEYTDQFGWIWISDEPFGWASYHYGRWGFDEEIGWYWVPATEWAPAWVSWRRSDDYVAWAPLPPDSDTGPAADIDIDSDQYADRYWSIVPAPQFLSADLRRVVIRDRDKRFRRVFRETRPLGRVQIVNKVVVNKVIQVDEIERITRRRVKVKEVREVNDIEHAGRNNAEENTVAVFAPRVEKTAEKPKRAKSVEEVNRKRKGPTAKHMPSVEGGGTQVRKQKQSQPRNAAEGNEETLEPLTTTKKPRRIQQNQQQQPGSETAGPATTRKRIQQQMQQGGADEGGQAVRRKPARNEGAIQQMQENPPGAQRGNQSQNRRKKCLAGAGNCPG